MDRSRGRMPAVLPCALLIAGAFVGQVSPTGPHAILPALWVGSAILVLIDSRRGERGLLPRVGVAVLVFAFGAMLSAHDRAGAERRRVAYFAEDGSRPFEGEISGELLDIAEPSSSGDRLLRVTARPVDRPELPKIKLSLRVSHSPSGPTGEVDRLEAGQPVRTWCRVRYPRGLGNPDSPGAGAGLGSRGIDAVGNVKSARLIEAAETPRRMLDYRRLPGRVKYAARERLDRLLDGRPEARGLCGAMLLGDRGMLTPATSDLLRGSGLIHLVAISGLHVGLLVSAVVGLAARSRIPLPLRPLVLVLLVFCFTQLVGPRPSVSRAALAVAVVHLGRGLGRSGEPLNSLAWIASLLVAVSPASVLDPALQLTVTATAGILVAIGWRGAEQQSKRVLPTMLRVSGGAYLASAPLAAWHFGWVAPVALIANLPAVPLCAVVLFAGYVGIVVVDIPFLGAAVAALTSGAAETLLWVAVKTDELERGAYPVVRPSLPWLAAYYGACAVLGAPAGVWRRPAIAIAAMSALWIHNGPPPPPAPALLDAAIIDVGQGQAVVARSATGHAVLIDTGGSYNPRFDVGRRVVIPFVLRHAGRRLERVVLSHDHQDHVGGTGSLIRSVELGELCLPPGFHRSVRLFDLSHEARQRGVAIRLCQAGERLGKIATVLAPAREFVGTLNDRSVAVLLGRSAPRLLIPGDLEIAGERALLEGGRSVSAEGLVLSHHGSRTGSARELLNRVSPHHVFISCGHANRFGHPHPSTLRRVRERPVVIWRTDRDGAIFLAAEGGRWAIRATRPR